MAKEFFKNLPDTSTPLNASRLNGLLNGNEAMGNIVVGDVKCKNLLNINATPHKTFYSSPTVEGDTLTTSGTSDNFIAFLIDVKPNTDYTISVASKTGSVSMYDADVKNYIEGMGDKTSETFNTGSYEQITIVFYGNGTYVKPQLEEGTATEYVPYKAFGIESGSNSNGSWVKYDNGTMIFNKTESYDCTFLSDRKWGSMWESYEVNLGNYPVPFISTPDVNVTIRNNTGGIIEYIVDGTNTFIGYLYMMRPLETDGVKNYKLSITAIGRWK